MYLNNKNLTNINGIDELVIQGKPIIEFKRVSLYLLNNKLTNLPESTEAPAKYPKINFKKRVFFYTEIPTLPNQGSKNTKNNINNLFF